MYALVYILFRFMLVLNPGLNPVCIQAIRFFWLMYVLNLISMSTSPIFPPTGSSKIGLYDAGSLAGYLFPGYWEVTCGMYFVCCPGIYVFLQVLFLINLYFRRFVTFNVSSY